ncbi:DUF4124 domain-containing protein [Aliivibrio fischeri]|uniref:DUF4124 domain-containing protein n=1 Tax=Aliivibrio fischeri TaxID=668 RepID=UPI0012D90C2B|nr:DUF4124 domain-containing protein [Aliivibrio fischeri]MUK77123.1 DUF4124 domain-containing protein [Aliivibrio fischeri]
MSYKQLIFLILFSTSAFAGTVYTWEDSDGTRHFSDSPPPTNIKSKQLSLSTSVPLEESYDDTATSVEPVAKKNKSKTPEKKDKKLEISFSNLQQEETIRSSRGHITVLTDLNRKLSIDEKLQLMLDGSPYGLPQASTEWKLTGIDRGTHLITVVAIKDGKRIASSPIITVYLHRPSAN